MLDSEGCFCTLRSGKDATSLGMRIQITNSDWRLIERAKDIANRISGTRVVAYEYKGLHKWDVRLCSKPGICRVITAVARHLVVKKAQAAYMFHLASRRWSQGTGTPPWVFKMADKIRWHNRHWVSPDGSVVETQKEKTRQLRRPGSGLLSSPQETACGSGHCESIPKAQSSPPVMEGKSS